MDNVIITTCGLLAFVVFVWEHYGRIHDKQARPTVAIRKVTEKFQAMFAWIGVRLGHLSSFLVHLHVEEIGHTINDLVVSILSLLCSIFHIAKGYAEAMVQYRSRTTIILGTLVLSTLTAASATYFFGNGSALIAGATVLLIISVRVFTCSGATTNDNTCTPPATAAKGVNEEVVGDVQKTRVTRSSARAIPKTE